jgi:hypothetical protein
VYTDFFRDLADLKDMFLFFEPWTKTGLSDFHAKPFLYYLGLFVHYEWPALAAGIFGLGLFFLGGSRMRFWILTGCGTLLAYSLISYKTPWLILNILWPFAFVFGFAVEFFLSKLNQKNRVLRSGLIGLASTILVLSGFFAVRVGFIKNADSKEPYVYSHTDRFISDVMKILDRAQKMNPLLVDLPITVQMKETWPLPWLLEKRGTIAWGGAAENASVIFSDAADAESVKTVLREPYFMLEGRLRDSYAPIVVFFKASVFPDCVGAVLYEPGVSR